MSQAEVLEVLGSPNIVTKNSSGNEVWTYDKISSSQSSSNNASATYGQAQLVKDSGLSCLVELLILCNLALIEMLNQNHLL